MSVHSGVGTEPGVTAAGRPFRFGVVAPVMGDMAAWREQVRRIGDLGYSTVLMPDVPGWQPSPSVTLAVAATITDLRVSSWVYASPLRPAWEVAWEAHSLTQLTEGRFDLGIGTGRPGIQDLVRDLGLPPMSAVERLERIRVAVQELRRMDGPAVHTPVAMAVRGPRARALATELADIVTIAATPADRRDTIEAIAREFRGVRDIELALHVSVVGETVAPFMAGPDTVPSDLRAADSLAYLSDDPSATVDELERRREECGFSYVVVGSNCARTLAPVVARLAGG